MKPDDHERLRQLCDASGLSVSGVVRKLLRQSRIPAKKPEGMKELAREINYIGHNINQIARAANGRIATSNDIAELKAQMTRIELLMRKAA